MKMLKKYWWVLLLAFVVYKFWDKIKPMLGMKTETQEEETAKTEVDDYNEDDLV